MAATRQADLGPLPCLVGLAAPDAQPQPAGDFHDILDLQADELGTAQGAGCQGSLARIMERFGGSGP
jgi:hypothetical protein